MKNVCPDCGYESSDPGNCPSCETPLLRREDEELSEDEDTEGDDAEESLKGEFDEEEDDEEW